MSCKPDNYQSTLVCCIKTLYLITYNLEADCVMIVYELHKKDEIDNSKSP